MNIFSYPFMQRALLAALLSGLVAPAIGMYIVQRRLSLLGDGLGHVAIMGVGLALLTGTAPLPMALVTCVAGSVAVELLRQSGKTSGDLGLAVLFYGGIASGVMMAGISGQGPAGLSAYLFGALTSVSESDLWVIAALAVAVLVFSLGLLPRLFAVCADEDFSRLPPPSSFSSVSGPPCWAQWDLVSSRHSGARSGPTTGTPRREPPSSWWPSSCWRSPRWLASS